MTYNNLLDYENESNNNYYDNLSLIRKRMLLRDSVLKVNTNKIEYTNKSNILINI